MPTLEALRNGTVFNLSDSIPIELLSIAGIGIPPIHRSSERGPQQVGDTDLGGLPDPRMVQLLLQAITTDTYSYESNRDLLLAIFKPSRYPLQLRWTRDSGQVFQLDTRIVGGYEMPSTIETEFRIVAPIMVKASDPLWYDPTQKFVNFGLDPATHGFTIPMPVPTFIGDSTLDQTINLVYAGTYEEYPIILIYGPITDPIVSNVSTGYKIDFTGYTIEAGDYYTIDLRYGRKLTYRNGDTSDRHTAEISTDSNLSLFSLQADPDVSAGVNVITVTGSGITSQTQIYIRYYNRYIGV